MKFKPAYLFCLLAIIAIVFLIFTWGSTVSINVHDTYFILGDSPYYISIVMFSLITALMYTFMDKNDKPIKTNTGFLHFGIILVGLLLSRSSYRIFLIFFLAGIQKSNIVDVDFKFIAPYLIGPTLLFAGLIVFLFGFRKANRI